MLKTLLKKQLYEINRSFFYDAKKNVSRSKTVSTVLIILYALLMVGYFGGLFGFFGFLFAVPLFASLNALVENFESRRLMERGQPLNDEYYLSLSSLPVPDEEPDEPEPEEA